MDEKDQSAEREETLYHLGLQMAMTGFTPKAPAPIPAFLCSPTRALRTAGPVQFRFLRGSLQPKMDS